MRPTRVNFSCLCWLAFYWTEKDTIKEKNKTRLLDLSSNFWKSSLPYQVFNNHLLGTTHVLGYSDEEHEIAKEMSPTLTEICLVI